MSDLDYDAHLTETERLTLRNSLLANEDMGLTATEATALAYVIKPVVERILQARLLDLAQRAEADRAAVERVKEAVEQLANDRDECRAYFRAHNRNRSPDGPTKRPDLDTWANAYEVAERLVRAALDPKEDQ